MSVRLTRTRTLCRNNETSLSPTNCSFLVILYPSQRDRLFQGRMESSMVVSCDRCDPFQQIVLRGMICGWSQLWVLNLLTSHGSTKRHECINTATEVQATIRPTSHLRGGHGPFQNNRRFHEARSAAWSRVMSVGAVGWLYLEIEIYIPHNIERRETYS